MNKKLLFVGIAIIIFVFIIGIYITNKNQEEIPTYISPSPEEVVRQYFVAWNNKNYPDMYTTISDGFKKIEPTAKDLASFKEYVDSQNIERVEIVSIDEKSSDGKTALVDYSVKFILNIASGNQVVKLEDNYNGTFTLKYRQGDVISGWKLIHPYGDNIDSS